MKSQSAGCFDALASDARWGTFTAEERLRSTRLSASGQSNRAIAVLEPGCGSGRLTAVLADLYGADGRVEAFDCSPEFLRVAAKRRLAPHVSLRAAWADSLVLAQESFDHVICFQRLPASDAAVCDCLPAGGWRCGRAEGSGSPTRAAGQPSMVCIVAVRLSCTTISSRLRGRSRACCARPD